MSNIILIRSAMIALAFSVSGCVMPYKSVYKQTQNADAAPVGPDRVHVARNRQAVDRQFVELGAYQGHAPTTREAMDAAKRECGRHGANFFILNTEPFQAEGVWKVDGVCARAS